MSTPPQASPPCVLTDAWGARRKKLDAAKRREIAESVITGRKTGAEMARPYGVSQPTVSRIVATHRASVPTINDPREVGARHRGETRR